MISQLSLSQVLSSGRSRTVSLGEEGAAGLERMEMEEVGVSERRFAVSEELADFGLLNNGHFQNLGIA